MGDARTRIASSASGIEALRRHTLSVLAVVLLAAFVVVLAAGTWPPAIAASAGLGALAALVALRVGPYSRAAKGATRARMDEDALIDDQRRVQQELESTNRDRDAGDASRTETLEAYAKRERMAAALGCLALGEDGIGAIAGAAATDVCTALNLDVAGVYELLPDGRTLALRGGHGAMAVALDRIDVSKEGLLVGAPPHPPHSELAVETLALGIMGTDASAGRVHARDVLARAFDAQSFISLALVGEEGPVGLLLVGTKGARIFGRDDMGFLRIVVNVLSGAIARERMETARRTSQQLAAMGRLASGVAHEINTPVQFIAHSATFVRAATADLQLLYGEHAAFVDDLADHPEFGARARSLVELRSALRLEYILESLPKSIDRIQLGAERVAETVRAIRPLGATRSASDETDVNDLLRSASIITNHLTKRTADVRLELADLPRIAAHPGEILQVLQGLIANAVDAIESRERRGSIVLRSFCQGSTVIVEVEDDGCGIPDDLQPKVFEPFRTTKGALHGTGQGLAIARDIVERGHHGSISAWSEVGRGTTIRIVLPTDLQNPTSWRTVVMANAESGRSA
jgi:signal transduction histidine kinase